MNRKGGTEMPKTKIKVRILHRDHGSDRLRLAAIYDWTPDSLRPAMLQTLTKMETAQRMAGRRQLDLGDVALLIWDEDHIHAFQYVGEPLGDYGWLPILVDTVLTDWHDS
jgi:hypothetical protein